MAGQVVEHHRLLDPLDDPAAQAAQRVAVDEARHDQKELVAAHPRHAVVRPRHLAELERRDPKHVVAGRVAVGVVDVLEQVEVELDEAERNRGNGGPLRGRAARKADRHLGPAPVVKAGERVGERLRLCRLPRLFQPQVRPGQFGQHGAVRLVQEQHLHRQLGACEVLVGQRETPHRVGEPDPEPHVQHHGPVAQSQRVAPERDAGPRPQPQEDAPLVREGFAGSLPGRADGLERGREGRLGTDQLQDGGAGPRDAAVRAQVQGHRQQRRQRREGARDRQRRPRRGHRRLRRRAMVRRAHAALPPDEATSAKLRPRVNCRSGTSTTIESDPRPGVISASAP